MQCPECGSTKHHALKKGAHENRQPIQRQGRTWRRHECEKCGKIFISVQTALTEADASLWMELMEAGPTTTRIVG